MRQRYTAWHKLGILVRFRRLQAEDGLTLSNAALCLGLSPSLLCRWKKLLSIGVPLLPDMRKKATHDGPLGHFAPIEDKLLQFVFKMREQGMAVSTSMIVIKASILDVGVASKTRFVKYAARGCIEKKKNLKNYNLK